MNFEKAVEYVLQNEEGFVDNPKDPGGATNFGITGKLLAFHRNKVVDQSDVKNLTIEEAKDIYREYFWNHLSLDDFSFVVATAIFDTAVNQGEGQAVRHAQRAIGFIVTDGVLGPKTRAALKVTHDEEFIYQFVAKVQDYYADLVEKQPSELVFLKGWLRRSRRLFLLVGA